MINEIPTKDSSFTYTHDTLKFPEKSLLSFPSMLELHDETNTCSPNLLLATDDYSLPSPPSPLTLHNFLTDSDCLFFIQYLPENAVKSCWFLIQINHIETELLNMDSKSTGDYHVTFISRHPNDNDLCDETVRWWPLWYEYKNDKNNVPTYDARMLFGPKRKQNSNKYII